jgi:hypothetical protein
MHFRQYVVHLYIVSANFDNMSFVNLAFGNLGFDKKNRSTSNFCCTIAHFHFFLGGGVESILWLSLAQKERNKCLSYFDATRLSDELQNDLTSK